MEPSRRPLATRRAAPCLAARRATLCLAARRAALCFAALALPACHGAPELSVEEAHDEQLTAFDPAGSPDWRLERVVAQVAGPEGESEGEGVADPAAAPRRPRRRVPHHGRRAHVPVRGREAAPGGALRRRRIRPCEPSPDGAAALEQPQIIGADDRTLMATTSTLKTWPYRTIGSVLYSASATSGGCTGTRIGPRHALTAAHCLHDNAGTWYWPLFFSPGHKGTGADRTPNGAYRKVVARYARTFDAAWDYGLMILEDRPETASLGWLGFGWWSSDSFYANRSIRVFGYPLAGNCCAASPLANKTCGGYMYLSYCTVSSYTGDALYHKCDTQGGNSGSAIQSHVGNDLYAIGVHKGLPEREPQLRSAPHAAEGVGGPVRLAQGVAERPRRAQLQLNGDGSRGTRPASPPAATRPPPAG